MPRRRTKPPRDEDRSLKDLERLIRSLSLTPKRLKKVKKVRRNKVGGFNSGVMRKARSIDRATEIRAYSAQLEMGGETATHIKLMKRFGVSRSTIHRALRNVSRT